jgi:hypothetical protein
LISDGRESLTRLGLEKSRRNALALSLGWMALCAAFFVSELLLTGPGRWLPERFQEKPAPAAAAAPAPAQHHSDIFFTVTSTNYVAYWSTGPSAVRNLNGNWTAQGIERLKSRLDQAAPRVVLVLEAGGEEKRLLEALKGTTHKAAVVKQGELMDFAEKMGRSPDSLWTQVEFAAQKGAALQPGPASKETEAP